MSDFLGGSEIAARADMVSLDNTLKRAELEAVKAAKVEMTEKSRAKELAEIKKVSTQFESIFLSYMLKQMKKTVPDDSLFGKSTAKDIFYDMHYDNVGKELAQAGGIGLATILFNQLSKNVDSK